jgi:uncharacterized SAM-binding protein YcdF (DUF218 family)
MVIFIFSYKSSRWKAIALKINIFTLLFLLISFTNIASWIMWSLESHYSIPNQLNSFSGIIVLGGSKEGELSTYHNQATLNGDGERLYQAAKLALQYPNIPIIHSGGVMRDVDQWSENDVAEQLFSNLGIYINRVRFERKSYNTYTNAIESKKLIKKTETYAWLLVTSAYHMPRAVITFQNIDLVVMP